jgi:hypothetical protein
MLVASRASSKVGDTPGAAVTMAKKKREAKGKVKVSGGRIGLRTGEALVEADEAWSAAEPEVVIGELDGPVAIPACSRSSTPTSRCGRPR